MAPRWPNYNQSLSLFFFEMHLELCNILFEQVAKKKPKKGRKTQKWAAFLASLEKFLEKKLQFLMRKESEREENCLVDREGKGAVGKRWVYGEGQAVSETDRQPSSPWHSSFVNALIAQGARRKTRQAQAQALLSVCVSVSEWVRVSAVYTTHM